MGIEPTKWPIQAGQLKSFFGKKPKILGSLVFPTRFQYPSSRSFKITLKMAVDKKAYQNSISWKQVWKTVFWFGLFYVLQIVFRTSIDAYFVTGVLQQFPNTIIADILLLIAAIYIIIRITGYFIKGLLPDIYSLILIVFIVSFDLVIRFNPAYEFYKFHTPYLKWVTYVDFACFLSCLYFLHFKSFKPVLSVANEISIIADEANPEVISDLIHGEGYVTKIASTINATSSRKSISIGIYAAWGSGKTDFLLRLKKQLQKTADNTILEFNPWKASGTESINNDFFTILSDGLKPFDRSIVPKLKSYSKKVFSAGKEVPYRILDAAMGEIIKEKSLEEEYDNINESIRLTGKRFIIIIDDLDRMSGKEVMDVLRLIRNSANFDNTFFIVAMDHDYIVSVLSKTSLIAKEDQYLKKIFQLTITLPKIRKENFRAEITRLLITKAMLPEDTAKIERVLSLLRYGPMQWAGRVSVKDEYHLEQMLDNFRDVKRFCNAFKISFDLLKDEVDILDLFMLELIKVKSFSVFEKIASRDLLQFEANISPNVFGLDPQTWKSLVEELKFDKNTEDDIHAALVYLLDTNTLKSPRAFGHPHNFYLYFCYQLFNLISLKEFNNATELDWKAMRQKIDQWVSEGKLNDLNRILDNYKDFKDVTQFEKFAKAYLLNQESSNFLSYGKGILLETSKVNRQYFKTNIDYRNFIKGILSDNELPYYDRAVIANAFLEQNISGQNNPIFKKKELQEIIYSLFDEYLNTKQAYDYEVHAFYLLNDDSPDKHNRIKIYEKASERLREFITQPDQFEQYLKYLIRSVSLPNQNNEFTIEPFTIDIFRDWSVFRLVLESHEPKNDEIKVIRNIALEHLETIVSQPRFAVTDSVRDFLLNHMRTTGQYNIPDNIR